MMDYRKAYGLPDRYLLSLGRMVEKKNLATLVAAYAKFCDEWRVTGDESGRQEPVALVFVGSGELEEALREQARGLGLRVIDRTNWKTEQNSHRLSRISTDGSERLAADRTVEVPRAG
ncbi:MAG: glycosyltransferase [Chthoniobacterales bacterium]